MQKGIIKRLTDRGFGFITVAGSDKDLFFHSNELQGVAFDDLREGEEVQFETANGPKGENATNVSRVSGGAKEAPAEAPEEEAEAEEAAESKDDDVAEEPEAAEEE